MRFHFVKSITLLSALSVVTVLASPLAQVERLGPITITPSPGVADLNAGVMVHGDNSHTTLSSVQLFFYSEVGGACSGQPTLITTASTGSMDFPQGASVHVKSGAVFTLLDIAGIAGTVTCMQVVLKAGLYTFLTTGGAPALPSFAISCTGNQCTTSDGSLTIA